MKRTVYLLGLLLCFSFSFGQSSIIFQTGLNYSMLQKPVITNDHTEFNLKVSYTLGTGIKTHLSSNLNLFIGLTYNHYCTGVEISASSAGGYIDHIYDLKLGFATISILPEYYLGSKKRIFMNAGPYLSVITSSNINGTYEGGRVDGYKFSGDLGGNLNEELRNVVFGLLGSVGLRVKMTGDSFFMPQLSYNFGLVGIEKPYNPNGGEVLTACFQGRKMRALCFLVEFDFRIGKKIGI
jgi:hypothetical protein